MDKVSSSVHVEDEDTHDSITMVDVLQQQKELEENASAVLGASDEKNCTYSNGYIGRQALYACQTCSQPGDRAGICLACSLQCHEGHDLVELYTKRNFRCDCGNGKFGENRCTLEPVKDTVNEKNVYNQNFDGKYCTCSRPYPDPDGDDDDVMIQCIICEDWLHAKHSDGVIPADDEYEEMICHACFGKSDLLKLYFVSRVGGSSDVEISATCLKPTLPKENGWEKGAVFFPNGWREKLCRCDDCKPLYGELEFLLDPEDEVKSYEDRGRTSRLSEYDQGMQALSSMGRVQQIEVLHEYISLKTDLTDYLKQFAEQKRVVSEDDIHRFFEELREKKRRRVDSDVIVPSSCR